VTTVFELQREQILGFVEHCATNVADFTIFRRFFTTTKKTVDELKRVTSPVVQNMNNSRHRDDVHG
jgi:hypothetical protein